MMVITVILQQKQGEPIKTRKRERDDLPRAFEVLSGSVQLMRKAVDLFKQGDEKYNHLEAAQVEKVKQRASVLMYVLPIIEDC